MLGLIGSFLPAERKIMGDKSDEDILPLTEPLRSQPLTTYADEYPDAVPIILVSGNSHRF